MLISLFLNLNGSEKQGKIDNAGTFSWVLFEVLEKDLELTYEN